MNIKYKFIMALFILNGISMASEVGRNDGGEYCDRAYRSNGGGIYQGVYGADLSTTKDASVYSFQDDQNQASFFQGDMNFEEIKNFFPILTKTVHGYPLIYFDSGSTAQMPAEVLNSIVNYYQDYKSNVGRGQYEFAELSTLMFEKSRAKVARFIGAKPQEIVFTSGATASINLVVHVWAKQHIGMGDEILVSEVEHNANFIPWRQLALANGAVLKVVPVADRGIIDIEVLKTYLSDKTKLVAITHQSNILGTTNNIEEIVAASHEVGAKVLVDAAQSVVHQRIDVAKMQCDFLSFSGHKLFGPTGVGVCFIKQDLFEECALQNFGGGIATHVSQNNIVFKDFPHCLEPGTQPIAQVIGLGAAVDFMMEHVNFDQVQHHETQLVLKLAKALEQMPGIRLVSIVPKEGEHSNMVTFISDKFHAYDIAEYLDKYGIAVRSGVHCVQPYHDKLGGNYSTRVSFSMYNDASQVDFLIECLQALLSL
ncbi:MAG: aminotransferase class V-fold PLP-dependent enzyme [Candidatus Dependentiae bacterium]|nr:aminotransferase class V-fold PLP-dependent enzyme [Candidatus Dependentiae bacterium]